MIERKRLPNRRYSESFRLRFGNRNRTFHVTCGYYDGHKLGEIFINGGKTGQEDEALSRDGAVLISLALQHGVSLEILRDAVTRNQDGTPSTIIGAVLDELCERELGSRD
jgi:hypothetical protein